MTPPNIKEILAEFDEKFVDMEGCQAGHETQSDCPYCKRWGGAQGEPKLNKRPLGSSGDIKSHIRSTLIALIKSQIEQVEGRKKQEKPVLHEECATGQKEMCDICEAKQHFISGRTATLDTIITDMKDLLANLEG